MKDFADKVVVITGAANGIGRGLAEHAAGLGMNLVLADIDEVELEARRAQLAGQGAAVTALSVDVSNGAQVEALAEQALARFGSIDLVFNNAGVLVDGTSWERSVDDWEWIIGVNLWGAIHGVRTFVPIMLEQASGGHIVNTASQAGITVGPYLSPYNVTKQGVVALTETLHLELSQLEAPVQASVLCPGTVATNIWHSEEHRPASLSDSQPLQTQQEKEYREIVAGGVAAGMAPAELAQIVFDALRAEQFWIFTHPHMLKSFETRAQSILTQTNPVFGGISESVRRQARARKETS